MPNEIKGFFGDYRFLSNFYPSPISLCIPGDPPEPLLGGHVFPTVEHAYQASKSKNPDDWAYFAKIAKPGEAKRYGRRVRLRDDWEEVKIFVMAALLWEKFAIPELKQQLLATGDAYLEETNQWGDRYWGVCGGEGKNVLGTLLMDTRARIVEEAADAL